MNENLVDHDQRGEDQEKTQENYCIHVDYLIAIHL